jgi:hypothetical protein
LQVGDVPYVANNAASEFVVDWDALVRSWYGVRACRADHNTSVTPSANAAMINNKPTRSFFPTGDACSLRFARTTADNYQTVPCASTFQLRALKPASSTSTTWKTAWSL